ncbi:hypothetical protein GCM10023219_13070 [Stakelama sediminis]|uniref:Flagellar FliJ protein n=1 Tax=Stakelama sediminis TaxID=463200 RepID=A0A840YWL8_9SPHN|nr:hypothetical protein [Stakelama sediminis]MBB5718033.1 hypothetical protein [Stakelama sediminis]
MAERSKKRLDRIHRVRTLQLDLVRADEARAAQRVSDESNLRDRIHRLSQSVAPVATPAPTSAGSLIAAAHYRHRLHQSAEAAERRIEVAEAGLQSARGATREAKREQTAVEKLIERAEAEAARRAMRALEAMPGEPRKRRNDPE